VSDLFAATEVGDKIQFTGLDEAAKTIRVKRFPDKDRGADAYPAEVWPSRPNPVANVPKEKFKGYGDWVVQAYREDDSWVADDNHYYADPATGAKFVKPPTVSKTSEPAHKRDPSLSPGRSAAATLALPPNQPPPGYESKPDAITLHQKWVEWVNRKHPAEGLTAQQAGTEGAIETVGDNGKHQTSCSAYQGNVLAGFGLPEDCRLKGPNSVVPYPSQDKTRKYIFEIDVGSPRAYDLIFLNNIDGEMAHNHAYITGFANPSKSDLGSKDDPVAPAGGVAILDFSGGQATFDNYKQQNKKDVLRSYRVLFPDKTDPSKKFPNAPVISGLPTGGVGEDPRPERARPIVRYGDMWRFFYDHCGDAWAQKILNGGK
jgi:hypothetical protein